MLFFVFLENEYLAGNRLLKSHRLQYVKMCVSVCFSSFSLRIGLSLPLTPSRLNFFFLFPRRLVIE